MRAQTQSGAEGKPVNLPDMKLSVRQVFGIDSDLEVPAFSKPDEHVPELDADYLFNREVTLAILETDEEIQVQHYAFLVSDAEFDRIFGREQARGLDWWADPMLKDKGRINRHDGGRGVYF